MNRQEGKISAPELTAEEMDDVGGGYRNNQTEAWNAFCAGMLKGL